MTDTPAPEAEAPALRASLAKAGVEHAQVLAQALKAVLDSATHPGPGNDRAKSATQTLGLYLATVELLAGIAPAGRLAWLAAVEDAVFPPAPSASLRRGRINPAPTKEPTP